MPHAAERGIISRDLPEKRTRREFSRTPLKATHAWLDLYGVPRNFYFGSDATMVSGSARFASLIASDPSAFGLTSAQALAYGAVDAALQSAYRVATTPSTRTAVAVARKNAAVKAMQRSAVPLAFAISTHPAVSDSDLIALGLLPRRPRSRRNAPDDPPMIQVISVSGRLVRLRVYDRNSPTCRSKPFGAWLAEIHWYVGEESPADPRAYRLACFTSRTTTQLTLPNSVPSGATAWLSARWVSARGETSRASVPLRFTLQGGPATVAAAPLALAA
jgi:hypothetical protein